MWLSLMLLAPFVSSCSLVFPAKVAVFIPMRPELEQCMEKPEVSGTMVNGKVQITVDDAVSLRLYMHEYARCQEENIAALNGHIEKLENRLKAVNGN